MDNLQIVMDFVVEEAPAALPPSREAQLQALKFFRLELGIIV
ncbi:hypothetical protein [Paenibacillus sp. MER 99-2]|nr:hypothetical protein [Paenibacillus sp. MER 99-2]